MAVKKPAKKKATKPAFKLDPKRKAKMQQVLEELSEEGEADGSIIREILALYVKGYQPKEIVAMGYNRSTVYRQTNDFKKLQKAPALEYYGYALFETRVRNYMKAKGCGRDVAVKALTAKDLE